MDGLECELKGKKVGGAIVKSGRDADAGAVNNWMASMMIVPSRSDSWACYGLFGSLTAFRFSCSVGKKLGLVALPPHVPSLAQAYILLCLL
jgi:hypothetical protein